MALSMEYSRKVESLINQLEKRMYVPCIASEFSGFVTKERLPYEEACNREKKLFPAKTAWGQKWEYGWFFTEVVIPDSCKGKRVVFKAALGESIVWVNGRLMGALDKEHDMITLTRCAVPGEKYCIVIEAYAGHTNNLSAEQMQMRLYVPEDPFEEFGDNATQKVITNASTGVFLEELFQLWMDLRTLAGLRKTRDQSSWRLASIDKCLMDVCDTVNIELPIPQLLRDVEKARRITGKCLACKNGSSAPVMYAIGNSHLDLEWLWTKAETRRKSARTLGNQIRILEEYDDYKYLHSQPWILDTIKNEYPDLYDEVKQWVKKGRIIVEGGMWVESDTNIPGGESLIRQFIVGKKFIKTEFDVDSEILWLPDIFGVSANLPQIMKGCGIKYFMNAKLTWLYNEGEPFPYSNFIWQGIDGSEIQSLMVVDYAADPNPSSVMSKWNTHCEKEEIPARILLYGHGDGGGGVTRIQQEYIEREKDLEGLPKVRIKTPKEYFEYVKENCNIENTYVGEMYYAAHRGTYTSQAKTKQLSRYSEAALREAEIWSALCGLDSKEELDYLWKEVLFNHFHDIIPGSSIAEVHKRAEKSFTEVINQAKKIAEKARKVVVTPDEETLSVFNSLSWERKVLTKLPASYSGATDTAGNRAQTQRINGEVWALLDVPALGVKSWKLDRITDMVECEKDSALVIENNLIRAVFNEDGELVSLKDKNTGVEFIDEPSNRFRMYQDATYMCDAWDIDSYYEKLEVDCTNDVKVTVEYKGDLESALSITRTMNNSVIRQRVTLKKDSPYLAFQTEVDWDEIHKLLKVDFNTNIHTNELLSEIQFGYVKRPNHKSRRYDADRFEVCQHRWSTLCEGARGVALLNDCKYGISADGGRMSLTLLRAATAPALYTDKGVQTFTYAVMPYSQTFFESDVIERAYDLNYPAKLVYGSAKDGSMITLSKNNVILEAIKTAEDGSGDLILRLYESKNSYTSCKVVFGFEVKEVFVTNMLEENTVSLKVENNSVDLRFKAFEIVTLRVKK